MSDGESSIARKRKEAPRNPYTAKLRSSKPYNPGKDEIKTFVPAIVNLVNQVRVVVERPNAEKWGFGCIETQFQLDEMCESVNAFIAATPKSEMAQFRPCMTG